MEEQDLIQLFGRCGSGSISGNKKCNIDRILRKEENVDNLIRKMFSMIFIFPRKNYDDDDGLL